MSLDFFFFEVEGMTRGCCVGGGGNGTISV